MLGPVAAAMMDLFKCADRRTPAHATAPLLPRRGDGTERAGARWRPICPAGMVVVRPPTLVGTCPAVA